ncbi:MAG: KamA family radical SAM protein [Planctomycetota bacterium]|nr:KamA family radical SAM protein [Planctomycetota bacterium]
MNIGKGSDCADLCEDGDEPPLRGVCCASSEHVGSEPIIDRACGENALSRITRFPIGARARDFWKRHYSRVSRSDWNNWHWQLQNVLRSLIQIEKTFRLSPEERDALSGGSEALPVAITPYYAALLSTDDSAQALRRTMIPVGQERMHTLGEASDPLDEDHQSPVPGLIHRYPDRVLFMATEYCSAYCRYCTRTRLVGRSERTHYCPGQWEKAIAYIEATPAVRDVIISGGDPLTLPDEALEWLLMRLRDIPHVEVIRIGTKTPAVLPMRITSSLTKIIRRFHPVWLSLHFTHPDELTPETTEACERLADAGAPLGSQTVILKGINDDPEVMRRLMTGLMRLRVRPYYLYQCDPIYGSAHFRTPVAKGLEIVDSLRGRISGYAVPQYVIDAPGGGGKVPLLPGYYERGDGDVMLTNYEHRTYHYPDIP